MRKENKRRQRALKGRFAESGRRGMCIVLGVGLGFGAGFGLFLCHNLLGLHHAQDAFRLLVLGAAFGGLFGCMAGDRLGKRFGAVLDLAFYQDDKCVPCEDEVISELTPNEERCVGK